MKRFPLAASFCWGLPPCCSPVICRPTPPSRWTPSTSAFIINLTQGSDALILVNTLCSVARGFGKRITAEFVENAEIFALIEKLDIDYAQGYYVGRPSPAYEFLAEQEKLES